MKASFKFNGFQFSTGARTEEEQKTVKENGDVIVSSVKTPDNNVTVDNFEISVDYSMEEFLEITKLSKDMLPDIMPVWKKMMMSLI